MRGARRAAPGGGQARRAPAPGGRTCVPTSSTGAPRAARRRAARRGPAPSRVAGSTSSSATSQSSAGLVGERSLHRARRSGASPGVDARACRRAGSARRAACTMPSSRLRVVCGFGVTIASFSPTQRGSAASTCPAFGGPSSATTPARCGRVDSARRARVARVASARRRAGARCSRWRASCAPTPRPQRLAVDPHLDREALARRASIPLSRDRARSSASGAASACAHSWSASSGRAAQRAALAPSSVGEAARARSATHRLEARRRDRARRPPPRSTFARIESFSRAARALLGAAEPHVRAELERARALRRARARSRARRARA